LIQYEKSSLPKLLATENITIKHGNFPTAWFDIKNRVLGLPLWKDMGKDVYDLLIGHEVGHALETPFEGWHDSPKALEGAPRSYINVIEDARIERKIQSRYPGLVTPFQKGYRKLYDEGFFGDAVNYQDSDWNSVKLIDKINLKTKLRSLIEVPFNDEEVVFYKRALTTETFEEVVQLVRDILEYTKENQSELLQPPAPQEGEDTPGMENEDDFSMGHDDMESQPQENQEEQEEQTSEAGDESDDCKEDNDDSSESNEDDTPAPDTQEASNQQEQVVEEDTSETDDFYRGMEDSLLEDGLDEISFYDEISDEEANHAIVPYKVLADERLKVSQIPPYRDNEYEWECFTPKAEADFNTYFKSTKKAVAAAAREFEQKKAAYQWQKASVAKTGNINVNKLWAYKTDDDIFLRSTKLANAKSHGMQLLVDFSGSMCRSMPYVLDQVIHTVMFCKAVNIPFTVHAFTTGNKSYPQIDWDDRHADIYKGKIQMDGLYLTELTNSDLNKTDFLESIRWMWFRVMQNSNDYYWSKAYPETRYENLGSTPLDQSLIVMHKLIKKFINKTGVEKHNFLVFTDGDANSLSSIGYSSWGNHKRILVGGKLIDVKRHSRKSITSALLENIKKRFNSKTIGFFMAEDAREWSRRLNDAIWDQNLEVHDQKPVYTKEYRKNKCVEIKDIYGYDNYYFVKGGKHLSAQDEDFEVSEDASRGQLAAAFKKHAKSKKTNKVLMSKFAEAVA